MSNLASDVYALYNQGEHNFATIGRKLGVSRHTAKNAYYREVKRLEKAEKKIPLPTVDKLASALSEKEEKDELKELASKEIQTRRIIEAIERAIPVARAQKPLDGIETKTTKTNTSQGKKAILLISDVHFGQYNPARLVPNGEYGVRSSQEQWRKFSVSVLRLLQDHKIEDLLILDLGDSVDGDDMRISQHRLIQGLAVEQAVCYGWMLGEMLLHISGVVSRLRVERVPGNHGRIGQKSGLGGLAEIDPASSYDWIAGEIAKAYLAGRKKQKSEVSFYNHGCISHHLVFAAKSIMFEHGSSLPGSGSIGIPYSAIQKALYEYKAIHGNIDFYIIGHYHRFVLHSFGSTIFVANGAFPATSVYIYNQHHSVSRPMQTMIVLDNAQPLIYPIYL